MLFFFPFSYFFFPLFLVFIPFIPKHFHTLMFLYFFCVSSFHLYLSTSFREYPHFHIPKSVFIRSLYLILQRYGVLFQIQTHIFYSSLPFLPISLQVSTHSHFNLSFIRSLYLLLHGYGVLFHSQTHFSFFSWTSFFFLYIFRPHLYENFHTIPYSQFILYPVPVISFCGGMKSCFRSRHIF